MLKDTGSREQGSMPRKSKNPDNRGPIKRGVIRHLFLKGHIL